MHFNAAKGTDSTARAIGFVSLLGGLKGVSVPAVARELPVSVASR